MSAPVRCTEQPADRRDFCIRTLAALIRQGKGALFGTRCQYRHAGRACAVGVWIPDDSYSTDIEGELTSESFRDMLLRLPASHPLNTYSGDLSFLQRVHDMAAVDSVRCSPSRGWIENLHAYWRENPAFWTRDEREVIWSLACELADSGATL